MPMMKSNLPAACHLAQMFLVLLLLQGSHKNAVFGYVRSPVTTFRGTSWKMPSTATTTTTMAPFPLGSRNSNTDEGMEDRSMEEEEDEIFSPTRRSETDRDTNDNTDTANTDSFRYLDDLTPPPVNFARNSILFSENPSTKVRNNSALEAWKVSRNSLPALLTGAWPWRDISYMDQQPLGALYNMVIVRVPVLAVMVAYLYQKILQNHDLVIDLGFDANGPQAVPPVLVIAVLVLILL